MVLELLERKKALLRAVEAEERACKNLVTALRDLRSEIEAQQQVDQANRNTLESLLGKLAASKLGAAALKNDVQQECQKALDALKGPQPVSPAQTQVQNVSSASASTLLTSPTVSPVPPSSSSKPSSLNLEVQNPAEKGQELQGQPETKTSSGSQKGPGCEVLISDKNGTKETNGLDITPSPSRTPSPAPSTAATNGGEATTPAGEDVKRPRLTGFGVSLLSLDDCVRKLKEETKARDYKNMVVLLDRIRNIKRITIVDMKRTGAGGAIASLMKSSNEKVKSAAEMTTKVLKERLAQAKKESAKAEAVKISKEEAATRFTESSARAEKRKREFEQSRKSTQVKTLNPDDPSLRKSRSDANSSKDKDKRKKSDKKDKKKKKQKKEKDGKKSRRSKDGSDDDDLSDSGNNDSGSEDEAMDMSSWMKQRRERLSASREFSEREEEESARIGQYEDYLAEQEEKKERERERRRKMAKR